MANLSANSTIGGMPIWHKGIFPLAPAGDSIYFKSFKIYSENDKPQAVDNDFVSKASGGRYLNLVGFDKGVTIKDKNGASFSLSGTVGPGPQVASLRLSGIFAVEIPGGNPFILFDPTTDVTKPRFTVMGDTLAKYVYDESGRVFSPGNTPTNVQVGLGNVTNDKQVGINITSLQTMAGVLAAPNLVSNNRASQANHVPQFSQVVVKGSIQDFGYY
ncbi:hinge connector of long tail fiber protein distal connector [Pseudomonas phage PspYZU05]|uniref:Hinge connector of long tail fiber distal connector n=1 Tax=Pseudomonas phage PspYZU05 TaxID=1983556 RepID=A0A2U7N8E1_9CAUD|nr:hinge connector of long tail fiber protein distal connector [Pseudomonas phage PspYZU05]ASD52133.1 hinge connector of long tail fiber distal connector [Pseudomonas phage PspYZU05]